MRGGDLSVLFTDRKVVGASRYERAMIASFIEQGAGWSRAVVGPRRMYWKLGELLVVEAVGLSGVTFDLLGASDEVAVRLGAWLHRYLDEVDRQGFAAHVRWERAYGAEVTLASCLRSEGDSLTAGLVARYVAFSRATALLNTGGVRLEVAGVLSYLSGLVSLRADGEGGRGRQVSRRM